MYTNYTFELSITNGWWKLAPALAAGNCVVLTNTSFYHDYDGAIGDFLPRCCKRGYGYGLEAGKPLASSKNKEIIFTGETTTGRLIMQYVTKPYSNNFELGGKSQNISSKML